jgi:pimeloyl-ACP methyl ester carboxylesterase
MAWPFAVAAAQLTTLPAASSPAVDRLLTAIEDSYRAKDAERFTSLFTDDFSQVDVNRRIAINGIDAWRRQTESVNAAHREMARIHRGRIVHENLVIAEIEWSGTVRGAELASGALDRPYRFSGLGIMELAGGKIRRQVLFIDYASYREQFALLASQQGPGPAPGRLIDVGGRQMHLHCLGGGGPTVIVDPGAGGWSVHWMHLHEPLARDSRVCLYDRAGLGWSEPAPGPATSERAARDLARLLEAAGERGPFVLVGHSYGGYVARVLRGIRPDLVAGIVMVESGHEDQWERLPPPLTEITKGAVPMLREFAAAIRRGDSVPTQPVDSIYRDARQRQLLEQFSRTPGPYEELAAVIEAMDSSTAQVRRAGALGDLPLVVVSARRSFDAFRHLPIDVAASNAAWNQLQSELGRLSSCSMHLWSESGDHNIQVTDPAIVVEGIRSIVQALSPAQRDRCGLSGGDSGGSRF